MMSASFLVILSGLNVVLDTFGVVPIVAVLLLAVPVIVVPVGVVPDVVVFVDDDNLI